MTKYVEELIAIIRGNLSREELIDRLFDYHDNDIAEALELLTPEERKRLYSALGAERVAEIFAYLDDGDIYLKELSLKQQAKSHFRDGFRRRGGHPGGSGRRYKV